MTRLVHKLEAFTEERRVAKEAIRARIWQLYADLKAYALAPTAAAKTELSQRFDAIFTTSTCFVLLNRQLKRLHAKKAKLLAVLDRPDVPLHTNGSEHDIRAHVTRRKVSGGTRSDAGRDCRDAFLGLMKTCSKQAIRSGTISAPASACPGLPTCRRSQTLSGRAERPIAVPESNRRTQTGSLAARRFACVLPLLHSVDPVVGIHFPNRSRGSLAPLRL